MRDNHDYLHCSFLKPEDTLCHALFVGNSGSLSSRIDKTVWNEIKKITSLATAGELFETTWLIPFWAPIAFQADPAFKHNAFQVMIPSHDIEFCPVPPRQHPNNVLESKHGIICSVFLRIRKHDKNLPLEIATQRALRFSNGLYGSDILLAFEMTHEFSRPIADTITPVDPELVEAQNTLAAKRKLTRTLRSRVCHDELGSVGDMVDVFVKKPNQRRGK